MNVTEVNSILSEVDLTLSPGMTITCLGDVPMSEGLIPIPQKGFYLQVRHPEIGNGRKWRLSEFMTKSEVVQTAFMAYLAWMEHEARESFTYKGEAIFSPHYDVDALVELSAAGKHDVR